MHALKTAWTGTPGCAHSSTSSTPLTAGRLGNNYQLGPFRQTHDQLAAGLFQLWLHQQPKVAEHVQRMLLKLTRELCALVALPCTYIFAAAVSHALPTADPVGRHAAAAWLNGSPCACQVACRESCMLRGSPQCRLLLCRLQLGNGF